MNVMYHSRIAKAAGAVGIADVTLAAEILKMVVELQSNDSIYCTLLDKYGPERINGAIKRKINWLVQEFIVQNHFRAFMDFCEVNHVTIFNEDLESDKRFASNARMVFVIFLREVLLFKSETRITDDRE